MRENLDETDVTLLNELQRNARQSLDELAAGTGLSPATIQRRVRSLRERGVLTGDIALVDPLKVGTPMTFVVMVELERERLDQIDAFTRRAQRDSMVQQCYYLTGEADFCLICTASDMNDFEELTKRLFFEDSNVRRFRTSVVMGRKKVGLQIPVALRA
ncbi:Lrp/AsnC family transcriptional regulator [Roseobacter sp. YSTF-M11]|uniref:Lrp/AsnC family transcriptional regulator n=1 Tax=Roseobacter insulae TaxID=2859783 RepID=A0A9X1FWD5_9RHOB|nr:Lrp/AsnC family transcriptional regulator [Roseobacter insulae]MBW4708113.1 Lrp/AsnC family transcriptional regulator [Roseobacter insulae]